MDLGHLSTIRMSPFRFHNKYTSNTTTEGYLCFAATFEQFQQDCYDKFNGKHQWIVITKFNYRHTNNFLMQKSKLLDYGILSLIICSDTSIDSDIIFEHPKFISVISSRENSLLKYRNLRETFLPLASLQPHGFFFAKTSHRYMTNCKIYM
jgi:hypothetical protein